MRKSKRNYSQDMDLTRGYERLYNRRRSQIIDCLDRGEMSGGWWESNIADAKRYGDMIRTCQSC